MADEGAFEVLGQATLFGFEPSPVRARVTARSSTWRIGGALRTMAVFVVIAPFVAIFPPHAVWPIGALATGGVLARRRWIEHFTLESIDGVCPKCGAALLVKSTRLRVPHPIPCDGCHHEAALRLPEEVLAENAAA